MKRTLFWIFGSLLTFGLGVATVAIWLGTTTGEIPTVEVATAEPSLDVIATDLDKPAYAGVILNRLPDKKSHLRFKLENASALPIFLIYDYQGATRGEEPPFVMHLLECKRKGGSDYERAGLHFHFVPPNEPLNSGEALVFEVDRPEVQGQCRLRVIYWDSPEASRLLNQPPSLSKEEEAVIEKHRRSAEVVFSLG